MAKSSSLPWDAITDESYINNLNFLINDADAAKRLRDIEAQICPLNGRVIKPRFDAKLISARFYSKYNENKRTEENEPEPLLQFGSTKLFMHNDAASDLNLFIGLFLQSGNIINNFISKYDTASAAVLRRKATNYGILMDGDGDKDRPKGDPSYLTLARISEAFALKTVDKILREQIPGKLQSCKLFRTPLVLLLQHTIFPAVIPHSIFPKEFKDIAVILNIDFSILFSAPKYKMNQQSRRLCDLLYASGKFVDVMMKRSVLEEHERVQKMVEAGLLESVETGSDKKYKPTAVAYKLIKELPKIQDMSLRPYNEVVRVIQGKERNA